jgi:Do/DeqQ family serine protease
MKFFSAMLVAAIAAMLALAAPAAAEETGNLRETLDRLLRGSKDPAAGPVDQTVKAAEKTPADMGEIRLSFAPIVKKTARSVVNVNAVRRQQQQKQKSPFEGDPFFERFFGPEAFGGPRRRNQNSLGSGVIVSADGIVLTNNHVVENMDEVKVALADGREFECEVLLKDPKSDLAVLKIRDKVALEPIEVGDSDAVAVGDLVLAIGNPFGVGQTVTLGIVSAVSRSLAGINDYGYFIQTDAAINPGNSGGALVDMQGRLIGINTAIYSRSGGSVGIGYAIPANMTKLILNSAKTGGSVARPWLGAQFQNVTAEIADSLGLDAPRGAIATAIAPGTPADKAGIKAGDVIVAVNGQPIDNMEMLGYRLDTAGVGNVARLDVLSRGQKRAIDIRLEQPPETVPRDEREMPADSILAGMRAANLSPAVAQEAGVASDKTGVVLLAVARNSPAAQNGLRPGDILLEVNGGAVADTASLEKAIVRRQRSWQFVVERAGRELVFERNGSFFRQFAR